MGPLQGYFMIAVIFLSGAALGQVFQQNVTELCDNIHCIKNRVCRVMKQCDDRSCPAEFACLICIPSDLDKRCNDEGYRYTVAKGNPRDEQMLEPLSCGPTMNCPLGSTCVFDQMTNLGVCCYDRSSEELLPVTNCDRKCVTCEPACQEGYSCSQIMTNPCGQEASECTPDEKYGFCLGSADYSDAETCSTDPPRRLCEHDQNCPGSKKCCDTSCGGKACRQPIVV